MIALNLKFYHVPELFSTDIVLMRGSNVRYGSVGKYLIKRILEEYCAVDQTLEIPFLSVFKISTRTKKMNKEANIAQLAHH